MIEFLKTVWRCFRYEPIDFKKAHWIDVCGDTPVIVYGGEPISTFIVEGAGIVQVPLEPDVNSKPK
jgi:hypothetical protein